MGKKVDKSAEERQLRFSSGFSSPFAAVPRRILVERTLHSHPLVMKGSLALVAVSLLVASAAAAPLFGAPAVPDAWTVRGDATPDTPHTVRLSLARNNMDRMQETAMVRILCKQ